MDIISFSELEDMFTGNVRAEIYSADQTWLDSFFPCSFNLAFNSVKIWRGCNQVTFIGNDSSLDIKRVTKIERIRCSEGFLCNIVSNDYILGTKIFVVKII